MDMITTYSDCFQVGFLLKAVHILLCRQRRIALILVVPALCVHIVHHPDGQQVQVADGEADLYAAEQEQRRGHRAVSWAKFF